MTTDTNNSDHAQRLAPASATYTAVVERSPLPLALIERSTLVLRDANAAFCQFLEREAASAQVIIDNGDRMNRLIEDLLERSRLEAGAEVLRLAPFDLGQLCARIVEQDVTGDKRTDITLEAGAHLVVNGDASRIERVLINLLTNAHKFAAPASRVAVGVYRDGDAAVVSVADQGRGVDPEDLSHLFEKHYRARTAGQVEGTGLGLYISRLLVEAHGGQLWAESAVGVGSAFRFSLPVVRSQD